jgi:hypothetical protein
MSPVQLTPLHSGKCAWKSLFFLPMVALINPYGGYVLIVDQADRTMGKGGGRRDENECG